MKVSTKLPIIFRETARRRATSATDTRLQQMDSTLRLRQALKILSSLDTVAEKCRAAVIELNTSSFFSTPTAHKVVTPLAC